ncbi:MAG: thioredoxin family protein [Candidatus Gastranaerophilaceae bacterium]
MLKKLSLILIGLLLGSNVALSANYVDCDSAMNAGKPFILYLHSNTCGSCKRFTPIFNSVVQDMPYNVVDINYSYSQSRNVCTTAETKTIPAVYIVDPAQRTRSKVNFDTYFDSQVFRETLKDLLN